MKAYFCSVGFFSLLFFIVSSVKAKETNPFLPFWEIQSMTRQDDVTLPNIRPEQLKLLGLVWIKSPKNSVRILVELPDGKSAILNKESRIGPYQGRILEIRKQAVVIEEMCRNVLGDLEKKLTILTFSQQKSEQKHE